VIAPKANAAFVCAMEDVLDMYHEAYDPEFPVVCFDETNKQLIGETRETLPMRSRKAARHDYEYQRHGTRNLFLFFEPLRAWRHVKVTSYRKKADWAHCMQELVDIWYPDAKRIRVVMDNLNTHKLSVLYDTFEPAEARRLCRKLEIHYTPIHGSWLNMAEIEFSVLARQCLNRRIPSEDQLADAAQAWENSRNVRQRTVDWQFTTDDARIKLKKLYPSIHV
jgi:hypothetical protein